MLTNAYRGKRVWLSGHTGFKGSWLAHWLLELGAEVHGFSLPPEGEPSLFAQLGLEQRVTHEVGDIRDVAAVRASILRCQPDYVFHLAAQALVRRSYLKPLETYAANVMGTAHVLDALRHLTQPCAAVIVTTDKCYENREWVHGYREEDPLGGYDPYSSSKAAAEIAVSAWRRSFFAESPVRIASARAGNVIGGGDWAADRIVPDCIRALRAGEAIPVRNKLATRPWQHVLEPLSGYLTLGATLAHAHAMPYAPELYASAFNFGPTQESNRTVSELVTEVLRHWPGRWEDRSDPKAVHEAKLLQLSIDKACALLRWMPVWNFADAIRSTVHWYHAVSERSDDAAALTTEQITAYTVAARARQIAWAGE